MEKEMGIVIGIAGVKNSGKGLVSSMIRYIYNNLHSPHISYDDFKKGGGSSLYPNDKTFEISVADTMKKMLSEIYGIKLECFYSREYKDEKYLHLPTNSFIDKKDVEVGLHKIITLSDLVDDLKTINYYINKYKHPIIKLRTIMQYFGTNVCRYHMGEEIWLLATKNKIKTNFKNGYDICLISDIRFENEANMVKSFGKNGLLIVSRPNNTINPDIHESEEVNVGNGIILNNDKDEESLFNKVYEYILLL